MEEARSVFQEGLSEKETAAALRGSCEGFVPGKQAARAVLWGEGAVPMKNKGRTLFPSEGVEVFTLVDRMSRHNKEGVAALLETLKAVHGK